MSRLTKLLALVVVGGLFGAVPTLVVILVGLGVGYLLHLVVPAIDLGQATVVGVLAFLGAGFLMVQLGRSSTTIDADGVDDRLDDATDDNDDLDDEPDAYESDRVIEGILTKVITHSSGTGRTSRPRPSASCTSS